MGFAWLSSSKQSLSRLTFACVVLLLSAIATVANTNANSPLRPTGLVATGVNEQVLLGWYAPTASRAISDYIIEFKRSSDSNWLIFDEGVSNQTKAVVNGLFNSTSYDFRVRAYSDGRFGAYTSIVSATPKQINNISFVITGESNSGGIGANTSATAEELAPNSAVSILELTSGKFLFEDLDIGKNNLRDHAGLTEYYDTSHGLELQLANSVAASYLPDNPHVYLIKTGQGGSQVSEWLGASGYWAKFLQRTAAAKTQIPIDRNWVVWMSIGINDGLAGTDITTWKADMAKYIGNIKAELPNALILLTQFQSIPANSGYPQINAALGEIAAVEPNVFVIDTTAATGTDGANHWNYSGLKKVSASMLTMTRGLLGLDYLGKGTSIVAVGQKPGN